MKRASAVVLPESAAPHTRITCPSDRDSFGGHNRNHVSGHIELEKIPPEMLKVSISELFKRFHGHAAARKSKVIDFQSTSDLGALFTLKD